MNNFELINHSKLYKHIIDKPSQDNTNNLADDIFYTILKLDDIDEILVLLGDMCGLTLQSIGERLCNFRYIENRYDVDRDIVIDDIRDAYKRGVSEQRIKTYVIKMLNFNVNDLYDMFALHELLHMAIDNKEWEYCSQPASITRERIRQVKESATRHVREMLYGND